MRYKIIYTEFLKRNGYQGCGFEYGDCYLTLYCRHVEVLNGW